jgi:hypothetical protein
MQTFAIIAAAVLGLTGGDDLASRDGLFTDAAAVPSQGTIRFTTSSGAAPARESGASDVEFSTSVLWSILPGVAAGVAASNEGGSLTPSVSLRWQFLSQESAPVNAATLLRFKSVGFDATGSEIEAAAAVGRTFGRLLLVGNAVAGKGFGGDNAVDIELKTGINWSFSETLHAGAEARVRSEVALESETAKVGREFDLTAGPTISWRADHLLVQAIAGWGVPRGTAPAGPMAMALISWDL